ncbi:hypothetical protein Rifp1Sym_bl00010 [endosymbiont of Riftia pachyptila (vent Ph05)]|uniref:Uncharacterized protein n=1 Tax=endosymbiont of Riftia pachyptila (vent Ph05) TaxID=1048808 RepID=G2DDA8_9GAMM|nr:hypothetical protein Rifp1Sym_bl00010 [endosymbiont of Riftia pachyptila (vent Ph05)]
MSSGGGFAMELESVLLATLPLPPGDSASGI